MGLPELDVRRDRERKRVRHDDEHTPVRGTDGEAPPLSAAVAHDEREHDEDHGATDEELSDVLQTLTRDREDHLLFSFGLREDTRTGR